MLHLASLPTRGGPQTGLNSLGYLAMIEFERGHLRAAYEIASEGLETAERRGWTELVQAIAIYLVLAETELEWNNSEQRTTPSRRGVCCPAK